MKGKFLFVVGLGVGYVLGTRAGRERYEQIRKAAEDVWNQPKVQEGVETVKSFAMTRVGDAGDAVLDGAKKLVRQLSGTQTSTTRSAASKSSGSSGSSSRGSASTSSGSSGSSGSSTAKSTSSGAKSSSTGSKSASSTSKASGSKSGSSSSS